MITLSTTFGLAKGWSLESAVLILTAFNLTNGVGRFTGGVLSDIFGRNLTMSVTFLAAGICYLVLPYCNWLPLAVFLASAIGLGFGTLLGVSAPLVTDCFGIKHFGAVFGLIFTSYGFLAGPIGPSLSGYLLDFTNGNFVVVFGYLGAFCIVSSVLVSFVKPPIPTNLPHTSA
jgi:OFA family oxalate/formate antiporter-like MFS transporter